MAASSNIGTLPRPQPSRPHHDPSPRAAEGNERLRRAIGLMSGTSQDGVDVALIDTDGETIGQFGATAFRPYTKAERTLLRQATAAAANLTEREARPYVVAKAEALVDDGTPLSTR